MDTAISFLTPFAAFVAAEEMHASGVISVVVAGLLLGHKAPIIQTAQSRITERITWRTVAFVLENTVFLLIGLQLDWILADVADSTLTTGRIVLVCGATLVTVIVVRLAWIFATWLSAASARTRSRRRGPSSSAGPGCAAWSPSRPRSSSPRTHPHREVLLLVAFTVVAGTLLPAGADPAAADPGARRAGPRPGRGRAGSGRPAPAGRGRRPREARRAGVRRPPRRLRPDPFAPRPALVRRLGAARHGGGPGDAVAALRTDPAAR